MGLLASCRGAVAEVPYRCAKGRGGTTGVEEVLRLLGDMVEVVVSLELATEERVGRGAETRFQGCSVLGKAHRIEFGARARHVPVPRYPQDVGKSRCLRCRRTGACNV